MLPGNPPPGRLRPARIAPALACLGLAMVALPVAGDIFKCTDRGGNVTYQNEKCPTGTTVGRVEIFDNNWTADRTEKEAEWQRNAVNHRVVSGMPARWVREALGPPAEIRETTTGGANELWAYSFSDRAVQVGMRDGAVLWSREAPVSAPVARAAPAPQVALPPTPVRVPEGSPPAELSRAIQPRVVEPRVVQPRTLDPRTAEVARAAEAVREAELPRAANVSRATDSPRTPLRGRDCRDVLAELGKPDRQRELPASEAGGPDAATEYVYEPGAAATAARTRILCANGKVEGVDRSVAR